MMIKKDENLSVNDKSWQNVVKKYNQPDLKKSIWQICNSLIPYVVLWFLMYQSLNYSLWITLALSLVASGFLIRLFIIFHDCGHGSFFKSQKINETVGVILGIITFTPYGKWHQQHYVHHSTTGNLDKRGVGDIWTLTVDEYLQSSKKKQFVYRLFRNPVVLFTLGPVYLAFVQNRFTKKQLSLKEKRNVYFTNVMVLVSAILLSLIIGIKAYLLIQIPIILISHALGLWLFYVQHQFEDVSWERSESWDYKIAAIKGSSFLKLPPVLQWFTGNIGFHHVHHLSSRIPNYNLARCHYENEIFQEVKPIRLFSSFKTFSLNLWDEANQRLIKFRDLSRVTT